MNPREFTVKLLLKFFKSSAYSNLLLDNAFSENSFSKEQRAFLTVCFYGVIEKQVTLDYELSLYLKQPLKKLKPEVLAVLRLGAYQLLFMDTVHDGAAVNESVKLLKKLHCAYAAGLANAVLRKIAVNGLCLPEESDDAYLSVKYAIPAAPVNFWIDAYGKDNTIGILSSFSEKPQTVIRVNTLLTDTEALTSILSDEGVRACVNEKVPHSLILFDTGSVRNLKSFRDGLFHVEDTAAQMAALLTDAKAGQRVLDTCAAPGGKAFTIAEEMVEGEVICFDIYAQRVALIRNGAKRLGLGLIKAFEQDATVYNPSFGLFDRVLCDVPCSGLGIMRRKPEIRFKDVALLSSFSQVQSAILANGAKYVKQGGKLIYSTCTLNPAENEKIIEAFFSKNDDFQLTFEKTFFPHIDHTDGFFIAVMEKTK